jgi:hypothetical protein
MRGWKIAGSRRAWFRTVLGDRLGTSDLEKNEAEADGYLEGTSVDVEVEVGVDEVLYQLNLVSNPCAHHYV